MTRLSSCLRLVLGFGLGLGAGALTACFTPPSDDVLFACEFEGADKCPPDYGCEADNCCHRVDSDPQPSDDNWGSCALGGNSSGGSSETTGSDTTTQTGSDETGSDETGASGSDTDSTS